jgi:MFS family permease
MNVRLATATRETFASFRIRNFRLFFVGQGISQVGNWMTLIAQALLVLDITGDGVAVGVLTACQFAPVLLLGAWAGLIADRSDKRRLLLLVQVVALCQSFALAALAFMDDPPLAAIYAVASIGGLCMAFDNPARRSFVVEMVPEDHVHNAVSLNSAMMTSSRVIGPALAGLLITTVGYGWAFVVDGVSYVAVLAALWLMRTEELRPPPQTVRGKGQVREGLRYVRRTPVLMVPLVMMAVVGTLAFNFQVTFPLLVTRTFGESKAMFTLLFSVISAGALVGALWTARRRRIGVVDVVRSSAAFGVALLTFALAPDIWWAFPIGVLVGITSIGFLTASTAIVQTEAAPEMRGRVLALQAMVFLGSTPIGGPIVGFIAEHAGPRWAVVVGGLACLTAALYGTLAGRGLDHREAPTEEELAVPVPDTA